VAEENEVVIDPDFSYLPGRPSGRDEHHANGGPMGQDIAANRGHREKERRVDR